MNNVEERSSYKAGDEFRITYIPDNAKGKPGPWKIDRIITLADPATGTESDPDNPFSSSQFYLNFDDSEWGTCWIPPECCQRVTKSSETKCSCSINTLMAAGCTCGHLQPKAKGAKR